MDWIKIFPNEQEAIRQLPENKPRLLVVGKKRICLVRTQQTFYAVQDACTHNSASLSTGLVNHQAEIICPWHNYRFRLTDGAACDSSCRDLSVYPVRCDDDGFFVGM